MRNGSETTRPEHIWKSRPEFAVALPRFGARRGMKQGVEANTPKESKGGECEG